MTHWQGRGQQVSDRGRGPGNRMRRWIAVALACTVFLLLVDNAFAQAPRRRFESLDTGRIGGVHALVEDADGFIWVGGDGGLARFDGRQLLPIAPDRIGGAVNALALQGDARVWVASDRGVLRWDLAGQRLDEVPCDGLVDGVGQLQVTGEAVLALSRSGLYRVDANTLACAPVHIAGLPEGQPVERFWQDGQQLWLAVRDRGLWLCPHACTRHVRGAGACSPAGSLDFSCRGSWPVRRHTSSRVVPAGQGGCGCRPLVAWRRCATGSRVHHQWRDVGAAHGRWAAVCRVVGRRLDGGGGGWRCQRALQATVARINQPWRAQPAGADAGTQWHALDRPRRWFEHP